MDGTRYLVLSESEKYDFIYNYRSKKRITYVISHNYAKIKVDSVDSLPLEKAMTFHVRILTKSVFNKDKNNYQYILRKNFI